MKTKEKKLKETFNTYIQTCTHIDIVPQNIGMSVGFYMFEYKYTGFEQNKTKAKSSKFTLNFKDLNTKNWNNNKKGLEFHTT